jgi:hypothetical protein
MARYNGSGWHFQSGRHSNARKTGRAGGVYANWRNPPDVFKDRIKGGLADGVNPKYLDQKELSKGIKIESEHTSNPKIAEEIAEDHIIESPTYYEKLEKVEQKPKPIKIKVTHKEVRRIKNQLEKDLSFAIKVTKDPAQRKELEHLYRELRKADNHSAIKRYFSVYGETLFYLGLATPFQIAMPVIAGAMLFSSGMTGTLVEFPNLIKMGTPAGMFSISSTATLHSIRTMKYIKKREREIIAEKTKELKENTTMPDQEIHAIAKRVARQELSQTKIIHEFV